MPLFLAGIGSALEIYPVPHAYIVRRPFQGLSDAQLLASDWNRVGQALYSAMNVVAPEIADVAQRQKISAESK
jgi:hypothetical protein